MSEKQVYEGHSFKEEKKEIVQPPIEVLAGGFLPTGLRDLTDWDKWQKDKQKRKDQENTRKALESGDKDLFKKALKGKSIAQKTRMRVDQCMKDRKRSDSDDHHQHQEKEREDEEETIEMLENDENFRYITEVKPIRSEKSHVSIFVDATNVISEQKTEEDRLRREILAKEEAERLEMEKKRLEESKKPEIVKKDISEDPTLTKMGFGMVSLPDEHAHSTLLPAIKASQVGNYYGDDAKPKFYESYRELDRRRKILWADDGGAPEDELMKTIASTRAQSPFTSSVTSLREAISRPASRELYGRKLAIQSSSFLDKNALERRYSEAPIGEGSSWDEMFGEETETINNENLESKPAPAPAPALASGTTCANADISLDLMQSTASLNLDGTVSNSDQQENHENPVRSLERSNETNAQEDGSNTELTSQDVSNAFKESSEGHVKGQEYSIHQVEKMNSGESTDELLRSMSILQLPTLSINDVEAGNPNGQKSDSAWVEDTTKNNEDTFDDDEESIVDPATYDQKSPRATFLAGCLKAGLPPRTSAMLRKRLSSKLSLRSLGIGDDVGFILASSLNSLPFVSSIDLSDNNLTDDSMHALFKAIETNPNISEIDFSRNDIDHESAEGLATYLASEDCALKKMVLQAADIDDGETEVFITALKSNRSLEELDLSHNLLGKDEVLNVVKPDLTTGGEAIAELLRADECALTTLRVAWNMIRMQSAVDLCDSLCFNKTLTYLDLSYNSIGTDGSCTLGRALLTNQALKELHVKNNMVDPVGCFTICVGARETHTLEVMDLDGNPIGEAGARSLMTIPLVCGARLSFSARECDFSIHSNKIILNRREPVGKYELNMQSDYGRAVLFDIFDIVANHPSLVIKTFSYSEDDGKTWSDLKFEKIAQKKRMLTEREMAEIENQKYIETISKHEERIVELFHNYDEDGSGELDYHEFTALLNEFGMTVSEKEGKAIIESVDTDGGGLLELDEIITYVRKLGEEAPNKIFNLEHRFTMGIKGQVPQGRYIPSETGHVRVQVLDSFVQSDTNIALTRLQCLDLIDASKNSSNAGQLLSLGADNVRMRVDEAEMIHSEVSRQSGNPIKVLSKILPLVSSVYDSRRLLNYVVGDSQSKTLYLKKLLGPAYRPIIGLYDGYYQLNLSDENDRVCLSKLFEQNNTITAHRKRQGLYDTSQDGNWSCFRNEARQLGKDDKAQNASISVENFTPIPKHGHLEFDFSGSNRPVPHHDIPISDKKMLQILVYKLELLDKDNMEWAEELLQELHYAERKTLAGQGYSYWHPDFGRAKLLSEHVDYLYNNLALRKDQVIAAQRSEFVAVDIGQSTLTEDEEAKIAEELNATLVNVTGDIESKLQDVDENSNDNKSTDHVDKGDNQQDEKSKLDDGTASVLSLDTLGEPKIKEKADEAQNDEEVNEISEKETTKDVEDAEVDEGEEGRSQVVEENEAKGPSKKPFIRGDEDTQSMTSASVDHAALINYGSHDTIANRLRLIRQHGAIATEALCVCILEYCETFMSTRWMKSAHLALLVSCFSAGRLDRTDFGSYRVEIIILLFTRLLDIHNFEFVLMELTYREHACVVARIGALNLFNPWKPEGAYSLDLSRWEERQIAKILTHISVIEPGENWIRCEFCAQREFAPMPGWSLNVTWFTEDGFPNQGILTIHQYSGEGMFIRACQADRDLREKLLSLVLISPDEIHLGDKQPMNMKPIKKWTVHDANKRFADFPAIKWNYLTDSSGQAFLTEIEENA